MDSGSYSESGRRSSLGNSSVGGSAGRHGFTSGSGLLFGRKGRDRGCRAKWSARMWTESICGGRSGESKRSMAKKSKHREVHSVSLWLKIP